jgi:hypothetical protein
MYGCDGDADPGYAIDCWACLGKPGRTYGCEACGETGEIWLRECPARRMGPDVIATLRAYSHYVTGFLPEPGGMLDQAATFLDAVDLLSCLKEHHLEIERQKE